MGIIGDIIASVAQVGGAALDRRYNERMTREGWAREDTQLQRMAKDAAAAGIHPVAALGAGANYGSTMAMPSSGLGDAIGGAAASVVSGIAHRQERSEELALERQRLENENLHLANQTRALVLSEAQSRSIMSAARAAVSNQTPLVMPDGQPVDPPLNPVGGTIYPFGQPQFLPPGMSAQDAEDLFGEPGEWAIGIGNVIRMMLGAREDTARRFFEIVPGLPQFASPTANQRVSDLWERNRF